MDELDERYARGLKQLGSLDPGAPDRLLESTKNVAPALGQLALEFAYGDVYSRPGLDHRTRQIVTIAALTALGNAAPQLKSHIRNALNVGVTRDEIAEIMTQLSVYAGFPAALNGVNAAREVYAALDEQAVEDSPNES